MGLLLINLDRCFLVQQSNSHDSEFRRHLRLVSRKRYCCPRSFAFPQCCCSSRRGRGSRHRPREATRSRRSNQRRCRQWVRWKSHYCQKAKWTIREPNDEPLLLPNPDPEEPRDELPPPSEDPKDPEDPEGPEDPNGDDDDPPNPVEPAPAPAVAPVGVIPPVCPTVWPNNPWVGTFCSP